MNSATQFDRSPPAWSVATLNINTFCEPLVVENVIPVSYDEESGEERLQRREQRWTPVIEVA